MSDLRHSFAGDVRAGLGAPRKYLQPWWFYDALGSALFSAICELPEYYVTRAESEVLTRHGEEIARELGDAVRLVELGSGDCRKTPLLLGPMFARLPHLHYVPVDIDDSVLEKSARDLALDFPGLRIEPIRGDYRDGSDLIAPDGRTAVLFLGSSIGNLDLPSAAAMLREVRLTLATGDTLLLGADLRKPKEILEPAYDDPLGVTAAFNLNLLARINRELGGTFDLAQFRHRAFFNEAESRIEMHLVSRVRQSVRIESIGMTAEFEPEESIHTENSYKYAEADLARMAAEAGFALRRTWTDSRRWFADVLLAAL
ncbi:MAG TPA: L-histidine N(alpha)-methyltransferase [Thermoanaerobaculia bacterium]|nr:L-histidine N(alpha)-methyltransferase [Thermoanaerobaculia bacterium]